MAEHRNQNFRQQDPKPAEGDTFRDCNLSQAAPHTAICKGVKGLRFIGCNLVNCDLPPDAVIEDCLQCHVSKTVQEETAAVGQAQQTTRTVTRDVEHRDGRTFRYVETVVTEKDAAGTVRLVGGESSETEVPR
jgi:hypothetical protein